VNVDATFPEFFKPLQTFAHFISLLVGNPIARPSYKHATVEQRQREGNQESHVSVHKGSLANE
jgi:hypothetical protein